MRLNKARRIPLQSLTVFSTPPILLDAWVQASFNSANLIIINFNLISNLAIS